MALKKPLEIKIQLTEKCNFDCGFCFNKQGYQKAGEMASSTAKKAIEKTAEEGIEAIRLTGGEPLLHPNLVKLLALARRKGLYTMLNTNASMVNEKNAKEIAENSDNILISMHSLEPNKSTLKAIKLFSKHGSFLRAATILTKENIENLEKFHSAVSKTPFSQWVLLRQIPNALNKKPVTAEEMAKAVEKINSFNKGRAKKDRFLIENALPFCCHKPKLVEKACLGGMHEDGHSSLFASPSGKIKPSYFFDIPLGTVEKSAFLEAWESDFMKRMNSLEFIPETCHECKHVLKCMAGSRFSAFFSKNTLYALDPLAKPLEFEKELGLA